MGEVVPFKECRRRGPISGLDRAGKLITLEVGDRVRYSNAATRGAELEDTVRQCFYAFVLVQPYAANYSIPAVVLTSVSWLPLQQLEKVAADAL